MLQLSKYWSTWPNKYTVALTDAFKLSIDVQLGAIELATPVLAKTQI